MSNATNVKKRFPDFRIYKPRRSGDGAAMALQSRTVEGKYGPETLSFMAFAKQTGEKDGNATFDWDGSANIKLGVPDVSAMLCVLNGKSKHVGADAKKGLFHQNSNGNSVLNLVKADKGDGYFMGGSSKKGDKLTKVSLSLTQAEGEALRVVLEAVLLLTNRIWRVT